MRKTIRSNILSTLNTLALNVKLKTIVSLLLSTIALSPLQYVQANSNINSKAKGQAQAQMQNFEFKNAWVRQTLQNNSHTAVYGILSSKQDCQDLRLQTNEAGLAEIHQMKMEDQLMKMQAVTPFSLKANQAFELLGDYHIMLMDVKKPLSPRQKINISISCAQPVIAAQLFKIEVKSIQHKNSSTHGH